VAAETIPHILEILWTRNFFIEERSFAEIKEAIGILEYYPSNQNLYAALITSKFLRHTGLKGKYKYRQKYPSQKMVLSEDIFPEKLTTALGTEFEKDIEDLRFNFGKSGTCTAFLLRKILEKLIFLAFANNALSDNLKDKNGDFVGLKIMLNLSTIYKVNGKPFLMPKTAKEIGGIKFLGDAAAHDPLANVDMKVIIPVMPFIIIAYEELSKKL
jgi:hypothetical protein